MKWFWTLAWTEVNFGSVFKRWLGKSGQCVKWSFCLKVARMAVEQER